MKSISVFYPALNEEQNIKECIEKTDTFLKTTGRDYEIIIVNDGSTDNTEGIVQKLASQNPHVVLINNTEIHGYGAALKKGFKSSSKDLIFFSDSDLQFDITELTKFFDKIDDYDYVIGYRAKRSDPIFRSFNAHLYGLLVSLILGVNVQDLDCAFKIFNRKTIDSITLYSNGALINAELLYKLNKKKYRFTEIPVNHYPRKFGKPTGANISVIARMFIELFKLKFGILK